MYLKAKPGAIWDVSRFQGMSWFSGGGTKIVEGGPGVYLIPYTTRFHELQFFIVYGNTRK